MSSKPQILVAGIDFSTYGVKALSGALELASQRETGALHVVHVASPYETGVRLEIPSEMDTEERLDGRVVDVEEAARFTQNWVDDWLRAYKHQNGELPCPVIIHLGQGDPASELRRIAIEVHADFICVSSHGRRGLRRVLFGSVAEAIARDAPCNVIVIRDRASPEIEPPLTPEEEELSAAARERRLGRRHTYHYYDRKVQPARPPSVVGTLKS